MSLGSFFPEGIRKASVARALVPGAVLRLNVPFTTPPKIKRLVVATVEHDCVVFLINSNINAYILARPALLQSQVRIADSDYPFMDRDSHIDCSQLFKIAHRELAQVIEDDPGKVILGTLSPDDIVEVCSAVKHAKTLSSAEKSKVVESLESSSLRE